MNFSQTQTSKTEQLTTVKTSVNDCAVICDFRGIMFLPDSSTLIVSDLHLEKGAAFARRGMLHPPYDTAKTLDKLKSCIDHYTPSTVISLGDSFHDKDGADELPVAFRNDIQTLQTDRTWIWISGNHDPEPPKHLAGDFVEEIYVETLCFRHEPQIDALAGEVSGHLHPAAVITRRGRSVRRPCFATDGNRLIMPAFGSTTGGLSLRHKAFSGLFDNKKLYGHVLGKDQIYPIASHRMRG